jgi:hypothetical protein
VNFGGFQALNAMEPTITSSAKIIFESRSSTTKVSINY